MHDPRLKHVIVVGGGLAGLAAAEALALPLERVATAAHPACTVTLVEKKAVGRLKEHLKKHFEMCECYESVPSDGAGISDMAAGAKKKNWWVVAAAVFAIAAVAAIVVSRKR